MRSRLFLISGLVTCGALALIYSSCGGDTPDGIDGGKDGSSNNPDTTPPPPTDTGIPDDTGTGTDADIDTGVDAGPLCTSTPCVVQIAAGHRHACARINDGTLRCWGRNARGEVGTGAIDGGFDPSNITKPVQVGVTGVTHVTPSRAYIIGNNNDYGSTCAITGSGPQCWGDNQGAQLGFGAGYASDAAVLDYNPHPNPAAVQGLSGTITHMSQGSFHGCAVNSTNVMYCWGWNDYYPLARILGSTGAANEGAGGVFSVGGYDGGVAVTATQAAGGGSFTLALLTGGTVASWGDNYYGELGRVTAGPGNPDARPQAVGGLSSVTQIDAGYVFACALTSAGSLYCWGDNSSGQLGRGLTGQTSTTPTAISFPGGKLVTQFATGGEHTCTLMNDNSVYCWGDNGYQQLGVNQDGGAQPGLANTPQEVVGFTGKVIQVAAGGSFSCALIEGGSVMCWGSNFYGTLGRGPDGGVGGFDPKPGAVTF